MPLLGLHRVSKKFGGLLAVNQVSFSIQEGEVAFIVGPNGAGKTTLFNLIAGVFRPSEGNIHFQGQEISQLSPDQVVHRGIGRTFQIVRPLRNLTMLENTMLGAFLHTTSPARAAHEAEKVLRFLNMGNVMHLPARGLPLPMLKRLEIARALATRPQLILLDEVVAGLSTTEALALAELLRRLPEWGIAAIAGVEHVMPVVMRMADRVIVLDHGTMIGEGKPEEMVRKPEVIEAYLGSKYKELGL
jgi:branched-chain amino acid transport system ATP-binding protein